MTDQRPLPPRTGGGQHRRPGVPNDPDGTGVWTPSWDSADDPAATNYYSPARSQAGPGHGPPEAEQTQPQPGPRQGRFADPESTDHIPRVPPTAQREPELITHREPLPPPPPRSPQGYVPPGGPDIDGAKVPVTPEEEATLRRKKIWRRVRRIGYAGAAGLIIAPFLIFLLAYATFDVPSFAAVANRQQQPVTIYYSDGKTELAALNPAEGSRINIKYEDVPEHVRNAVLAAEDRTFYTNPGFDARGIARAVWRQANGEAGGGSGITQQYVKVATNEDDFTLKRKLKEVVIATKISRNTPKEQILENYLNIIYFGRQAYGIQAASQAYFGKNVKDLSVSEGALLAGMIQSPSRSDPLKNPERASNRWNFVLDGMVEQGWLSATERTEQQLPTVIEPSKSGPGTVTDFRRHIQNQVEAELADQGIDQATLNRIGGRIITTIDKPAQDKAVDAVSKVLQGKPENLHASLAAVDPKTGAVRAYFGGQDGTGYDLAGGTAWQPGSSFKPFVMLAGLEQGIGLGALYPGKGPLTFGDYKVDNSESADYPDLPLQKAMTFSVNTAFVALAKDVGPDKVADAAHQAGIPKSFNDKPTLVNGDGTPPGLAIGLGAYEVRTLDMAAAYASFASQGARHDTYFVQEYIGADDQSRYKHIDKGSVPAFDSQNRERNAQLACNVTDSLVEVPAYSKFPLADGRLSAAKTGTAQRGSTGENANTWTVGYTPSVSAAVWVGDPAQTALKLGTRNIFGSTVAGPIWKAFMDAYLEGTPKEEFPKCKPIGKEETTTAAPPPSAAPPPTTTEPPTFVPPGKQTRPPRSTTPPSPTDTATPTCGALLPCTFPPPPTTISTTTDNGSPSPGPPGRGG